MFFHKKINFEGACCNHYVDLLAEREKTAKLTKELEYQQRINEETKKQKDTLNIQLEKCNTERISLAEKLRRINIWRDNVVGEFENFQKTLNR
jgi:septal ring factor EnvC (AmiA/AmiB activator)